MGWGLKGKRDGCSSLGLDAARSVVFGAESLEAATSPTEDQNGSRVWVTVVVEDLGGYLEIPGAGAGLVEILFFHASQVVSQTMRGSGWIICCLLKADAQF